jgi:2-polyprenyl-3-methyl-5-hydroxy-6-metoxy-1,4-benzoquinol methylase
VTGLDRLLQRWRIDKAIRFVRPGDRLLDVGCHEGELIERVLGRVATATGVDPLVTPHAGGKVRVLRGVFPGEVDFPPASFDCITALAVLEHVPDPAGFARACAAALVPGGRVLLTVPHAAVDRLLDVLIALRFADGMAHEEHHGFDAARTPALFEAAGLALVARERFQLGLNCLYVFAKPAANGVTTAAFGAR